MIHRVVLAGLSWCILVCLEFSLHEKQPNHRKKLQIYKFTTNLDQSKQTVGVKKPSLSSVSTELFLSDMCLFVLSFLEHIEFVLKVPVLFHFVYFLFVEDSLKSLEFYTFLPTDSFCLWIRPISTISDTPYLLFSLCIFWVEGFISFFCSSGKQFTCIPCYFFCPLYLTDEVKTKKTMFSNHRSSFRMYFAYLRKKQGDVINVCVHPLVSSQRLTAVWSTMEAATRMRSASEQDPTS